MCEEMFKGLTTKQEEAVRTIDQNLEIIACAGAGKTKTITLRIINLIANGVKPENIVAITFTKKAAAEMKARIYAAGEKYLPDKTLGFAGMYIGTIDAFCLKMLQDYASEYAKFSVLDEVQTRIFMEHNYSRDNDVTGLAGSVIDKAWNLNRDSGKYTQKLDYYTSLMSMLNNSYFDRACRENWSEDLKNRLDQYNGCLKEHKYFDYSALIREMIEYLDPDSDRNQGRLSEFAETVFEKVKYLIIDEYQDTNPSQEYLVKLFDRYAHSNLCIVGDADQTIYQFRGSDESNILSFAERYHAKKIRLKQDFRSTEAIVDIAAISIGYNHENDDDYEEMVRGRADGTNLEYETGDAVYAGFDNYDEESDFIVERIRELIALGIPYSEIAVLFRKRQRREYGVLLIDYQEALAEKLKNAGIPYVVEGINNLSNTSEYKAAAAIFHFIDVMYYQEGEPGAEKAREEEDALRQAWRGIDADHETTGLTAGIDEAIRELKGRTWKDIVYGNEFNMQQIYQDFISHMAFVDSDSGEAEIVLYNLGKFSKVIADYELLFFKDKAKYKSNRFIRHLQIVVAGLYPEGELDNAYIRGDAVRLMTIHQSKGLEFTAVFIPTLTVNNYPGIPFDSKNNIYGPIDAIDKMAGSNGASWLPNYRVYKFDEEAERKMFYVAVTRSKKYLFLTWGRTYGERYDSYHNEYVTVWEAESDFLEEIKDSEYLLKYSDDYRYTADFLPPMKEDPIPVVLNFSLLSNYFDCPYRFKLSNFYGFVQPYITEQGYGKVLHEIMMHIHRAWIEGRTLTEMEIDQIAEDALYLPFASDRQLANSLQGAKNCAQAYVRQNAADADKMIASELDINIEMGEGVSVNGRIDLVRRIDTDGSDKIAIVDLKSAGKDAEQCLNAEQLKIYALGYAQMIGKPADYLMIYNLDAPDGSKNAKEEIRQESIDAVQEKIMSAANHIRNSNLPRCEGEMCRKCYVRGLCKRS